MKGPFAVVSASILAWACGGSILLGTKDGGSNGSPSAAGSSDNASGTNIAAFDGGAETGATRIGVNAPVISDGAAPNGLTIGVINAPDCSGCVFPAPGGPPCPAPGIQIVYPADTVVLPPNLNALSVQWTPYGGYKRFSVDFSSPPNTDWHILTSCASETSDLQGASGGCEVIVDPVSWSKLVDANRDGGPVTLTVRGTTDGQCVSSSSTISINFAKEDLLGTYFYWKSTITTNGGGGGQIWMKVFGDLSSPETDVTSNIATATGTLQASCNGCHVLSRDGSRMVVYSDDNDSDDEYSDIGGSFLDMTQLAPGASPIELGNSGVYGSGVAGGNSGQPPGFSAIHPNASSYITSNGLPQINTPVSGGFPTNGGYPANVTANQFTLWNAAGDFIDAFAAGGASDRPTMPDWSPDGTSVIYVLPGSVATYDQNGSFGTRSDDDHIFEGSLYTIPYLGNAMFGAPSLFLQSNGENNYYPSYSPDSRAVAGGVAPPSFVLFDRVSKLGADGCNNGSCPNDSFSNPFARLMLMANMANAAPIDLENANGAPAGSSTGLSNSYPRWAPFVQTYHGNEVMWFTFSSTRDYGLRVLNHKSGMHPCFPADSPETPGAGHGMPFDPECQRPQIWMAPILFKGGQTVTGDPSGVAFWLPDQDMTTHNHTAQWTWKASPPPPPPPSGAPPPCQCSHIYGSCAAVNPCGCCAGEQTVCSGSSTCIPLTN